MLANISLEALDQFITIAAITLLAANIWRQDCKITSASITGIAFIVLQCSGHVYKNIVGILGFLPEVLLGGVWYVGLSLSNLLAIFIISRLHSKTGTRFSKSTNYVVWIFSWLALLQAVRFVDRYYGFNILASAYQTLIPALNLAVIGLLLSATVKNLFLSSKI